MYVTAIEEKRGHESDRAQGEVNESVWREHREGGSDVILY